MIQDRLRQAREARKMSLAALEDRIGVRRTVLEAIERGAFADLPAGLYGRHAVRAYATAVGLHADDVLEEVGRMLPPLEDPLDGLARVRGFGRRWHRESSRSDGNPRLEEASSDAEAAAAACDWRPLLAGAVDGGLIAAIVAALTRLTALAAGVPTADVVPVALPAWGLLTLVIAVTYFVLLGGVRNSTFGAALIGVRVDDRPPATLDARSVVHRAMRCALRESSVIVEWLAGNVAGHERLRTLNQRG